MTKSDLPPIEDTIRHLREENADWRARFTERDMAAQYAESEERRLRIALAKVREVNAEQVDRIAHWMREAEQWKAVALANGKTADFLAEHIRQEQQRARIARSGE